MHVIGLDIGTTSSKAVVFDLQGRVAGEHIVEYPIYTPFPLWAEQDPDEILNAAAEAVKHAVQKAGADGIIGLGISSAMHSVILMNKDNRPLTKAVIWADNRSVEQAERIRENNGLQIYLRTGTPIHPMSPLAKILWFKEKRPELFRHAHKFISIKEYLIYHWFGLYLTDHSTASATGMFNLARLGYDEEALALLGISAEQLSVPVPSTCIITGMRREFAEKMGLPQDLPVVIGASDGCLANLGIGALEQETAAITIGTSAAIRTSVKRPLTDKQMRTFCYALAEDYWVIGGPTNNGAILLQWFRERFGGNASFDQLTAEAKRIAPGSDGLLCLPYLSGERAPIWDPDARGSFVGMALHHQRGHFTRAAMEGVVFAVYSVGEVLKELAGEFRSVRASGGFIQSDLWCQILADVFGTEVIIPENPQSSCWGAAILVLYALGLIPSLTVFKDDFAIRKKYAPDIKAHETYQSLYGIYKEIYFSLAGAFKKIAGFQKTEGK